ncbi:APC family permease [Williamsia serinedens]|uniref:Basic amino acid/polyamine antiporter, APA family n=1 Tax=Williamsia serinedens TaxID=391736 RepID=A0ABT1GYI6_9NOCA|nr:APC family permease [Williamsia serinedens]MCP2160052.1 basic amino acid/polyamine antiporter, APA family [Williamsia serinedens]
MTTPGSGRLSRRLSTTQATVIGLGSMIGAGVFTAFAPAAAAAGSALLVGLAVAAVVAVCNALSSAQLAAQYPEAGGTYLYGRERLGEWWGFAAGWMFVVGKTASCAAMALTVGTYLAGETWGPVVAVVAVAAVVTVNCLGVTRTATATAVIVTAVVAVLVVVVVTGVVGGDPRADNVAIRVDGGSVHGVLQAAGLLFFAFAGYARIATLAEEVRDPRRAIPRAIVGALTCALLVYAAVGVTAVAVLGPDDLADTPTPLVALVSASGADVIAPLVRVAAAVAALGALLALVAGIGRTGLAMARTGDLPRPLAAVHPRFSVPHRMEITVGVIVAVAVLTVDLRGAIGFSSFGVLLYYLVANLAAATQTGSHRRYPMAVHVVGAIGCVALAVSLPVASVVAGIVVAAVGGLYRLVVRRGSTSGPTSPRSG